MTAREQIAYVRGAFEFVAALNAAPARVVGNLVSECSALEVLLEFLRVQGMGDIEPYPADEFPLPTYEPRSNVIPMRARE